AIPLRVEERVERVGIAVEARDRSLQRVAKIGVLLVNAPDRLLQKLAVRNRVIILDELAKLVGCIDAFAQHDAIRLGRERQTVLVVAEEKSVAVKIELDLPPFHRFAVRTSENRQKNLRARIDIE